MSFKASRDQEGMDAAECQGQLRVNDRGKHGLRVPSYLRSPVLTLIKAKKNTCLVIGVPGYKNLHIEHYMDKSIGTPDHHTYMSFSSAHSKTRFYKV